jgi:hypothetical protein
VFGLTRQFAGYIGHLNMTRDNDQAFLSHRHTLLHQLPACPQADASLVETGHIT